MAASVGSPAAQSTNDRNSDATSVRTDATLWQNYPTSRKSYSTLGFSEFEKLATGQRIRTLSIINNFTLQYAGISRVPALG